MGQCHCGSHYIRYTHSRLSCCIPLNIYSFIYQSTIFSAEVFKNKRYGRLGMVAPAYELSTLEAEARGYQLWSQLWLQSETLSQQRNEKDGGGRRFSLVSVVLRGQEAQMAHMSLKSPEESWAWKLTCNPST